MTYRLATMMSTVGAALENLPEFAKDVVNDPVSSDARVAKDIRALQLHCSDGHRLLSTLVIAPEFHPSMVEPGFPFDTIRFFWIDLCTQLAAAAGVVPRFGLVEPRAIATNVVPSRWFVFALERATRIFGFRRRLSAEHVASLWRIAVSAGQSATLAFSHEICRKEDCVHILARPKGISPTGGPLQSGFTDGA